MGKIKSGYFLGFLVVLISLFLVCGVVSAAENGLNKDSSSLAGESSKQVGTSTTNSGSTSSGSISSNTSSKNNNQNNLPKKLSQNKIITAAKSINKYATKHKRLPNYVTISGNKYSMPEFLYLMSKTIVNKQKNSKSDIAIKYNIKNPSATTGSWVKGKIYSVYYVKYAKTLIKYSDKNKKVPNHIKTAGGNKLQYQTLIYLFSKVLSKTKSKLPYYVSINVKRYDPINTYIPKYTRNSLFTSQFPTKLLGKNDKGYVQFIGPIGNLASKTKIAYIIGMHPLENQAHTSLYNNLISKISFKYKYYIYKVTVTKNPSSFDQGRMNGQLLAQKYILPHAKKSKYKLLVDIHSNQGTKNGGNYKKTNFIFAPLNKAKSKVIATKIIKNIPGLSYYFPASQTSPPYCTTPLVKAGIKTLVYETYKYESVAKTNLYMKKLIAQIDKIKF